MKNLIIIILISFNLFCCSFYSRNDFELDQKTLVRVKLFADDIVSQDRLTYLKIDSISKIYRIGLNFKREDIETFNSILARTNKDIHYCDYNSYIENKLERKFSLSYSNSCYHYYFFDFSDYIIFFDFYLNDNQILFKGISQFIMD